MLQYPKISMALRAIFCICLFQLSSGALMAQDELKTRLYGNINSEDIGKGLDGATITILKNGSKINTITTDNRGKFDFTVDPGAVYSLEFNFPDHVTKRLQVDTRGVTPEAEWGGEFKFDMDLFIARDGLDVSVLNKPIAKLYFDPNQVGGMTFDQEYTASIKSEVDRLRTELDQKLKAEAEEKKQLEQAYSKAIADADRAMASEDYLKAKQEYARASGYKPDEAYPKDKLKEAQQKYELAQAEKNKEKAYDEAIESAEYAMYENNLKKAMDEFERALTFKPGDKYAKDQFKELQDKLMNQAKSEQEYLTAIQKADAALAAKDLITAKGEYQKAIAAKPNEEYPKGQLAQVDGMIKADAEKEQNYIKAIERADNSMDIKDYEAAKAAFAQAAEIKPKENYPKDQIVKIDKILADLAATNKAYNDAIKTADEAFAKDDFTNAKTSYNKALQIKPEEKYPKDQLSAIEKKEIEMANINAQYSEIIKEADKRYDIKEYVAAKAEYDKAVKLKPTEEYPKKRLAEVTAKLEEQAKIEEEYKAAIQNADNAFNANDYLSAKIEYENASKIKPNETYPKEQLKQVIDKIAAAEAAEEQYDNAIAAGDAAFKEENFEEAKTSFQKALELKPKEEYPKKQLAAIDGKLLELENINKEYNGLIANADKLFDGKSFEDAKKSYQEAVKLKPSESYPKERIVEIDKLASAARELDENYQAAIKAGDEAMSAENYTAAKTSYQKALELKSEEGYPAEKIKEIDGLMAEMEQLNNQYTALITKADEQLTAKQLTEAKATYQEALKLKSEEAYPKEKIAEIDTKIKAAAEADQLYANKISEAEAAEKSGELKVALEAFAEASKIKPEEQYPKDKMSEIKKLVAEAEQKDKAYNDAITLADEALKGKEYDIALNSYQQASEMKPEKSYPKSKIEEINKIKADEAAAIELANQQQAEYDKFIKQGDDAMAKDEFEAARKGYQAALGLKPEEAYPKDQLTKIDDAIKQRELAAAEADQLKEKQEKYDAAIAAADKSFKDEAYEEAVTSYQAASAILPDKTYPGEQIAKINQIKADKEAEIALANKELDDKYKAFITSADAAFTANEYEKAEADYRSALEVKPTEKYPQDQIAKIKNSLADKEAKEKEYNSLISAADKAFKAESFKDAIASYQAASEIKPSETYPTEQISLANQKIKDREANQAQKEREAREKEIQEKYEGFIAEADKAFKSEDFANATTSYEAALNVKPGEEYPTSQLSEIERLIAEKKAKEENEKSLAAAQAQQEKYDALIAAADKAMSDRDYEQARNKYKAALEVKPTEQYPTDQLAEMDRIIAEEQARMAAQERAAAQKELDEKYKAAIALADKSLKSNQYSEARKGYNDALGLKPNETYPKEQLLEIDRLEKEALAEANEKKRAEELAEREKRYKEFISNGDKSVKANDWNKAKSSFESALELKPDEAYPQEQLAIINEKIASQIALENTEKKYNDLIAAADRAFNSEDYTTAKYNYEKALGVKPEEQYPKDQITKADQALASLDEAKRKEDEEKRKLNARYNDILTLADRYFETEDYKQATEKYKAALEVKPDESYPQDQINKISELIAAKESDAEERKRREQLQGEYKSQIERGDRAYSNKSYSDAISAYDAAIELMPNETYPKKQIKKIRAEIAEQKEVAVAPVEKPRAKISGKSEEDIAAMMAELKRKREQEKLDRLNRITKDLNEVEDDRIAQAKNKRENENSDLNLMREQINSDREENKELYLTKVEELEVYMEKVEDRQKQRVVDADTRREESISELDKLKEEQQRAFKEGDELHLINADKVATKKIEVESMEDERIAAANERRTSNENEVNRLAEGIKKRNEGGEEVRQKSIQQLEQTEEDLRKKRMQELKEAEAKRMEALGKEIELREQIKSDQKDGKQMHLNNAEKLARETKDIEEARQDNKESGDRNRMKNYDDIQEYTEKVDKQTDEKYNNYTENNKKVMERNKQVVEYHKDLSKKADDKRNSYEPDFYVGEKQPRKSEKASQYPQGVTEETYEDGNTIILQRIVVEGETLDEYQKIYYPWGGIFYKKNGQDITAEIWEAETN